LGSLPEFRLNYEKSGGKLTPEHYFKAGPTSFTFESFLQKKITFADHSLVTDAVFSETQLISCRNVLIYFDRELQNKVFGLFRESLCRKGFLGLGSQETMEFSQHAKHFDSLVKKSRIYQKK
jgi:chemotaxis protein methyltransferase CheR